MSDFESLPSRLRRFDDASKGSSSGFTLWTEAADEIERLQSALLRARPYVERAIEADGGFYNCKIGLCVDLAAIDKVLSPSKEQTV